jgi:lipid-binding SYLF domain-containing protein
VQSDYEEHSSDWRGSGLRFADCAGTRKGGLGGATEGECPPDGAADAPEPVFGRTVSPATKRSAGYAVFSNFGMKILFAGGGKGQGLAVNRASGRETFMKMLEVQAGPGMGIKKFNLVFVFSDRHAFDHFVNSGWVFGGQTTAAAKYKQEGEAFAGAVAVAPGVWIYQLTKSGLALELTLKGTKYYKDSELN